MARRIPMITNFTHSQIVLIASFYTLIALSGCAIHYRDAKTGAEHIWGFGHLAIKATSPEDSKQAVITQSTLSGISLGIEECKANVVLGWNSQQRIEIHDDNTLISVVRPNNKDDFFLFRVGSESFLPILPSNDKP